MLDPFDVLGISHSSQWEEIKLAYKRMCIRTHPDKMNGDAKYFMMVHEAFNTLQERHNQAKKYRNMPKSKKTYDPDILQKSDGITPQKLKRFTNEGFNQHFHKNKIDDNNPYFRQGYGSFMKDQYSNSKIREDIDIAKQQKVHIPKQQLVIYKEPEQLYSSPCFSDCYQFGQTEVCDYSGGGGTDIMQAYCHQATLVDTAQRYNGIEDIKSSRSNQSLAMTQKEQEYYKQQEEQKCKLEQYRLSSVQNENKRVAQQYIRLNRRLK